MDSPRGQHATLSALREEVVACRACPRLVRWRESVALQPPRAHAGETYWARPLPGFGDEAARLVLVGLAPAAHGGNRTGRMFTGDRSGDFLFAALHRAGFATTPESIDRGDGLLLRGAYVTAAVRCAPPENKPSPEERRACARFLSRELALLTETRVLLALGAFAYAALVSEPGLALESRPPPFAHGLALAATASGREVTVVCSYHPSQRNVFTGRLDATMLDSVLERCIALGAVPG